MKEKCKKRKDMQSGKREQANFLSSAIWLLTRLHIADRPLHIE